ncbi:6084_t:CDS:2, partial [Funneliformis geosporum]
PLYTFQGLHLELQIRILNNLLEIAKREDVVTFATIQRIQKEVNRIKDFIRFHKLKITIDEILEDLRNNQVLKENPNPFCIHCYLITEQPSEEFGRFCITEKTVKAFGKAKENKDNSVVLNQCFKLIITFIRYYKLAQESFEDLLNILENKWTLRKSSRKSSKVSKITRNNDDILVNTFSHDQNSPPKNSSYDPFCNPSESDLKWAELMYKIHDDTEFITNYENTMSSEERIKI